MTDTAYAYDATGAYAGTVAAQKSPLEPGVILCPARATLVPPPEVDAGQVPVWDAGAWVVTEDHRGVAYDTATGRAVRVTAPGPLPDGLTLLAPGSSQVWDGDAGVWTDDVAAALGTATAAVDTAAEVARLTYLTAGDGQAAEYRLTAEEATAARAVLDAGGTLNPADYPHLDAEVDAGGAADLTEAVALVEAETAAWVRVSAAIKAARRAGKIAIAAATDVAAVETARDQALAALAALRAGA